MGRLAVQPLHQRAETRYIVQNVSQRFLHYLLVRNEFAGFGPVFSVRHSINKLCESLAAATRKEVVGIVRRCYTQGRRENRLPLLHRSLRTIISCRQFPHNALCMLTAPPRPAHELTLFNILLNSHSSSRKFAIVPQSGTTICPKSRSITKPSQTKCWVGYHLDVVGCVTMPAQSKECCKLEKWPPLPGSSRQLHRAHHLITYQGRRQLVGFGGRAVN